MTRLKTLVMNSTLHFPPSMDRTLSNPPLRHRMGERAGGEVARLSRPFSDSSFGRFSSHQPSPAPTSQEREKKSPAKRRWLGVSFTLSLILSLVSAPLDLLAAPAASEPAVAAAARAAKTDRIDESVNRAVMYLIQSQNAEGAFVDPDRRNEYQTVMTALGTLALAAAGHQPSDNTTAGLAIRRGLAFILRDDRQTGDGYFGNKDGSRMYGHGIITLALSEMLGMGFDQSQDRVLREKCTRAIDLILRSQRVRKHTNRFEGGWRYTPDSGDADLSVTVWQLMALRSAKNAGLPVPKEAINAAVEYLKVSYKSNRDATGKATDLNSGFGYQPGGNPEFATTAAGLLALQVCGEYDVPEVVGATNWLLDLTDGGRKGKRLEYSQRWFFYGMYYFSQGMQKRGGEIARQTRQFTERVLLEQQSQDGSWTSGDGQERNAGRVYSTSLAILSLAVKYHYLPIYQN